ncbi:MAG: hypothetical protein QNJ90_02575 [Planctomycetota bacterium]|nr:hypothetical protein [Planctomycetota bacterium]
MTTRFPLAVPLLAVLLLVHAADPPEALSSAAISHIERQARTAEGPRPDVDPDGVRCPVCRAAEEVGLTLTPLRPYRRARCPGPTYPLWAATPRGRLRPEELSRLTIRIGLDIDDAFLADPYVLVRCGEAVLGRVRFPLEREADDGTITAVVPRELSRRLEGVRGRITWGRKNGYDAQAITGVWLDPPNADELRAVAELHARLAHEPRWIRDVLEAQLLLDQEFDHAALVLARRVLRRRPREPHAAAIVQAAYTYLGLRDLPAAEDHDRALVVPLHRDRRDHNDRCHLDAEGPRVRSRERRPPGGCG